ncbi:MAG: diguanylate cyclase [Clostridiales bacterium]|nr:diguanylate cyclase [Clostridiales bacterium]
MKKLLLIIIFCTLTTGMLYADDNDMSIKRGSRMILMDPDTRDVAFENNADSWFYRWTIDSLLQKNINEINILDKEKIQFEMSLVKGQKKNHFNYIHKISDGYICHVEVISYSIILESEEKFFSTIIDVMDKLSTEKKLMKQNESNEEMLINIIYLILIFLFMFIVVMVLILKANIKLKYLSIYDPLTKVFNRTRASETYMNLIVKKKLPIALFMIDVNNLKFINDTFGHIIGDEMIVKISNELKILAGNKGIVSRVSGDEFVVILGKIDESEIYVIEDRIKKIFVRLKGIHFNASVGLFIVTENMPYEAAFSMAESKMYTCKVNNRSNNNERIERELLNKLSHKMPDNKNQVQFVSKVVAYLGEKIGLSFEEIDDLLEATRVQDIGISVIEDLDEMELNHSEKGYSVLNALGKPYSVSNTVFHHHENYDSSGYPKGLKGMEIPLSSRILSVSNFIYYELSHKSINDVIVILDDLGGQKFDANLTKFTKDSSFIEFIKQILDNQP